MGPYSVLEYSYLSCTDNTDASSLRNRAIPLDLWGELADLVEDEDINSDGVLYSAGNGYRGIPRLKTKNYIGVIATESGVVEILPKLHNPAATEEAERLSLRHVVGNMLSYVTEINYRVFDQANQRLHTDLYEWFLAIFLNKVGNLVKRGLRSSYESLEDNLSVLKGRLLFPQHLRLNVANTSKLYLQFDEFTANRPENRLIHTALQAVSRKTNNSESKRLANELLFAFSDIGQSRSKVEQSKDFKSWRTERGAGHYRELKGWCKAILDGAAPSPSSDQHEPEKFESFLFPAEKLFEAYVSTRLQIALSSTKEFKVDTQVGHERALFQNGAAPLGKVSMLRPDIVITHPVVNPSQTLIVDAKWKIFDETGQIPSSDLYQLYVYGKYWGASDVAIVSPATSKLSKVEGPFLYDDKRNGKSVQIWILPYDLFHDNGGNFDYQPRGNDCLMDQIVAMHNEHFSRHHH